MLERVVLRTLETPALFVLPLCFLVYNSHAHIQMKRPTPTHTLLAPPAPLPDRPRLFVDTQAVSVRGESERPPIPPLSSSQPDIYVPTLGRRVVVAPCTPPPSPGAVELVGPLSPVLRWGKRVYQVDGLIAAGSYGRVAVATTIGPEPPKQFAIKVYCKDTLIADPYLAEMFNLERDVMFDITKRGYQWLVGLRGAFGDFWNKYLVMVRRVSVEDDVRGSFGFIAAAQDYYPNTLSDIIFNPKCTPLSSSVVRLFVEELVRSFLLVSLLSAVKESPFFLFIRPWPCATCTITVLSTVT